MGAMSESIEIWKHRIAGIAEFSNRSAEQAYQRLPSALTEAVGYSPRGQKCPFPPITGYPTIKTEPQVTSSFDQLACPSSKAAKWYRNIRVLLSALNLHPMRYKSPKNNG